MFIFTAKIARKIRPKFLNNVLNIYLYFPELRLRNKGFSFTCRTTSLWKSQNKMKKVHWSNKIWNCNSTWTFSQKKPVPWKSKSCRSEDFWEKAVSKALNSNFTEKELHRMCFPGNFLKFLENLFCRTYFYYSSENCGFQQIFLHQTLIIQRLPYEYEKIIWSRKRLSKWKLFWNNFFSRCNLRM